MRKIWGESSSLEESLKPFMGMVVTLTIGTGEDSGNDKIDSRKLTVGLLELCQEPSHDFNNNPCPKYRIGKFTFSQAVIYCFRAGESNIMDLCTPFMVNTREDYIRPSQWQKEKYEEE